MKQTSISSAVQAVVNGSIRVNTSNDDKLLDTLTETWDDLQEVKNTIAMGVLDFVTQVEQITQQQVIMANLGQHEAEFRRLETVFYSDLNGFTLKVQELRAEHEHRSGAITSLEDLNTYNRLAVEYAALNSQLLTLIGPTITSMIILVNEVVPTIQVQQQQPEITDVVAKNV